MVYLHLDLVGKAYDRPVLEDVNLEVEEGEFVSIVGPNGAGKTTLLNLAAGLESCGAGRMVNCARRVGYVFQAIDQTMLPWRTCKGNVELALEARRVPFERWDGIVVPLLKRMGLYEHRYKKYYELSGGLKQLTALARTFAYAPDMLLMDEPFSALDYSNTRKIEMALLEEWDRNRVTTLMVSHDVDEAILMSDRVVVLRDGKIKGVVDVDLLRPRTLEMLQSGTFVSLRNTVLKVLLGA